MMPDLIEKINSLAKMESNHASSLVDSVKGLQNIVVKEILRGIAQDSLKHEGFYTAIKSLVKVESPALTEEDYLHIEEVITNHIEIEEQMISQAKQLLNTLNDARIQHLLTEIYNDETKHHILMKRILEAIVRREAIFEEEWWDAIWQDVPFHGSPGG